jgi:hypothetical protein
LRRICGSRRLSPVRGNGGIGRIDRLSLVREASREHEAKPEAQTIWCVNVACGVDDVLNVGLDGDAVAQLDLVTRLHRRFRSGDPQGRDGRRSDDGVGNSKPQAIVGSFGKCASLHGTCTNIAGNGLRSTVGEPGSDPRRQPWRDRQRCFQGNIGSVRIPRLKCQTASKRDPRSASKRDPRGGRCRSIKRCAFCPACGVGRA